MQWSVGEKREGKKNYKASLRACLVIISFRGKNTNATREAASCSMWHLNRWLAKGWGAERNRSLDEMSRLIITPFLLYHRLTGANKPPYFHWSELIKKKKKKDCNINNFMFSGRARFIAAEAEVQFAMTGLSNNWATIHGQWAFFGLSFCRTVAKINRTLNDTFTMT